MDSHAPFFWDDPVRIGRWLLFYDEPEIKW